MKTPPALLAFLASVPLALAQGSVQYTIKNNCPEAVALRIAQNAEGNITAGASVVRTLGINAGFFFTTANGGTAQEATRVAFYGNEEASYYYIVKYDDNFNTGISVAPDKPASGGFCLVAECGDAECTNTFRQPPTCLPPPSTTVPPNPPIYACTGSNISYTITFCPSGSFPSQ